MKPPKYYRRFDYDRSLLPNRHLAGLETGVSRVEEAEPRTGYSVGYPGWNLLYYALLCHLDPESFNIVIETGTNLGCSTIILAQALRDSGAKGRVHTIEQNPAFMERAIRNLADAGLSDLVDAVLGDTRERLPGLVASLQAPVRAALLDASHRMADVLLEFEAIYPALEPDGIVIFGNTFPIADPGEDPLVFGALQEILRRHGGHLVNFPFVSWYTPGLAIWQPGSVRRSHAAAPVPAAQTVSASGADPAEAMQASADGAAKPEPGPAEPQPEALLEEALGMFPALEVEDVLNGLKHMVRVQECIKGRCAGSVADRLAQYAACLSYVKEQPGRDPAAMEIGTLFGGSCMLMLSAMKDEGRRGRVTCIDPMDGFYGRPADITGVPVTAETFLSNLEAAGFDRDMADLRMRLSQDPQAREGLAPGSVGVLLIDGDHSREAVLRDWETYREYVAPGGYVLFDDYGDPSWPEVAQAADNILAGLPSDWSRVGTLGTTLVLRRGPVEAGAPVRPAREALSETQRLALSALVKASRALDRMVEQKVHARKMSNRAKELERNLELTRTAALADRLRRQEQFSDALLRGHLRLLWSRLPAEGVERVWLFGAGKHTDWLLRILEGVPGPAVLGILDDCAVGGQSLRGLPILKPQNAEADKADAVVLSTDTLQALFRARCATALPGLRIIDLYEWLPDDRPIPKKTPAAPRVPAAASVAHAAEMPDWGRAAVAPCFHLATCNDLIRLKAMHKEAFYPERNAWGLKQMGRLFCYHCLLALKPGRALEVGAGRDVFFDEHIGTWCEYHMADQSGFYPAAAFKRAMARRKHTRHVHALLGRSAGDLPDAYFDAVFSVSVLEHVPESDYAAMWRDIGRITKPGGWTFHSLDVAGCATARRQLPMLIEAMRDGGFDARAPDSLDWSYEREDPILTEPLGTVYYYYYRKRARPWDAPARVSTHVASYLIAVQRK